MTESDLLRSVLHLAAVTGWRTLHLRPAKSDKGWRTAVEGDGAGFPDVLALKGDRGIAWELKSDRGRATQEQSLWLVAFLQAGFDARVLAPRDWEYIEKELTRD